MAVKKEKLRMRNARIGPLPPEISNRSAHPLNGKIGDTTAVGQFGQIRGSTVADPGMSPLLLHGLQFKATKVEGDGRCMYHALAFSSECSQLRASFLSLRSQYYIRIHQLFSSPTVSR
eukprot:GHVU01066869.1.p1 GENE.GHVU01066869.1~~GHVU01066869.1.p1  ORF type:complete len:118 (-),score=0.64 GHVU01066869.1:6-359(-)